MSDVLRLEMVFLQVGSSTGTVTPEIKTGPGYAIQSDDEDYFEEISDNEVTLQSKINQGGEFDHFQMPKI